MGGDDFRVRGVWPGNHETVGYLVAPTRLVLKFGRIMLQRSTSFALSRNAVQQTHIRLNRRFGMARFWVMRIGQIPWSVGTTSLYWQNF